MTASMRFSTTFGTRRVNRGEPDIRGIALEVEVD